MKKSHINLFLTAGVVSLFLLSSCVSGFTKTSQLTGYETATQNNTPSAGTDAFITCYAGGKPNTQVVSPESGVYLQELFSRLVEANACDPCSLETQEIQQQILEFAEEQNLLPQGLSADVICSQLQQHGQLFAAQQLNDPLFYEGSGREFFCNFASTGEGSAFPIIILPRLIPILMTPIPRLFVGWRTLAGITSVGGLRSGTGFIAYGQQEGLALGFWGIGFSIFLPPIMAYGMFGYALYARVSAAGMEFWPPNNPPEVSAVYPLDGASYVPLSTSELEFRIGDFDNDLMSFSVTTSPDVGGGNGNMKTDGTYTIPISGLKSLTTYSWCVNVSDGKDTVEHVFTFTTEAVAPIISEVEPVNGDWYVPVSQSFLRFYVRDPQNDLMSYTVETSPDIGSGSGSGVNAGYVTIPVSGLEYTTEYWWFVNATDGVNPTSEVFWFRTEPIMVFDPFAEGWGYRKMITVDHTMVAGDVENFPVLVSIMDSDLRDKAQDDGDDIVFMDDVGVATRLYHEVELFDGGSGRLVAWVNISVLSSIIDIPIWMYYGNSSCSNQENPWKVWDSNFEAVYHMNDETTFTILDSTQNNHDLTKYASNSPIESIDGIVGNCQNFDGSYDWMTAPLWSTGSELTVSVWVKAEHDFSDNYYRIYQMEDQPSALDYEAHGFSVSDTWQPTWGCDLSTCANQFIRYSDCVIPQNTWCHLSVTRALLSRANLFTNGIKATGWIEERSGNWAGVIEYDDGGSFKVGVHKQGSTIPYGAPWWGKMDEFRLSSCARDESWISTEYNSMMYPSSFIIIGPEETGP